MRHIFEDFNFQDGIYAYKMGLSPLGFDMYHFLYFYVDFPNFVPEDYVPPVDIHHGNISAIDNKSLAKLEQTVRNYPSFSRIQLDQFGKLSSDIDPFISVSFEASKDKQKVRLQATIEVTTKEYIYEYYPFPNAS